MPKQVDVPVGGMPVGGVPFVGSAEQTLEEHLKAYREKIEYLAKLKATLYARDHNSVEEVTTKQINDAIKQIQEGERIRESKTRKIILAVLLFVNNFILSLFVYYFKVAEPNTLTWDIWFVIIILMVSLQIVCHVINVIGKEGK